MGIEGNEEADKVAKETKYAKRDHNKTILYRICVNFFGVFML